MINDRSSAALTELPVRERRAIRARVRWLGHQLGWTEDETLALARYRVQTCDRAGLTPAIALQIAALERLLRDEIDLLGS